MTHEPITERVARGAAVLDEIHPSWREEVDITRLNMSSPFSCVLGQTYGGFGVGLADIEIYEREGVLDLDLPEPDKENTYQDLLAGALGFNLYMDDDDEDPRFTFNALWAAWVRELGHDPATIERR